jgi:hypothetical protein
LVLNLKKNNGLFYGKYKMKKTVFIFILFISSLSVWAQRLSTVGIMPFEAGAGANPAEAAEATRQVIAELVSWGSMTVLSGNDAGSGEYVVRGQVSRQNNRLILTAATSLASTGRLLNNSREEAAAMNAVSFVSFCAQVTENIPFPNYLLGRWRSTINTGDGPVTCIMEFRSDRTINVIQYDTWEHKGTNALKYQGIGSGTYTYAGYLWRAVTISGRQIQSDATVGINLTLEDALPKYEKINAGALRVLFDDSKNSFELVSGSLPCGENYGGTSVYPGQNVFYTSFTKIQ